MVGSSIDPSAPEPIFRKYIEEMADERLELAAVDRIWLCDGPYDEGVWKRDLIQAECKRSGTGSCSHRCNSGEMLWLD
jgi:hypothetical protein